MRLRVLTSIGAVAFVAVFGAVLAVSDERQLTARLSSHVPLYLDWNFWTALVAALALVLSQLPPLHVLLRRARVDLEVYSRIHLSNKVGNPNAQVHLIITNLGGRSIRVREIVLKFSRDKKEIATLPSQNYLQNPGDTNTVLFTGFSLKSLAEWAHTVNFLNYFSRADEKRYRSAESKLKNEIAKKRELPQNKDRIIQVGADLAEPFVEMFNEKFVWLPGEYDLTVTLLLKGSELQKKYRFTLFESDSADLSRVKDDYKSGDGIFWDSGNHPGVIVRLYET